MGGKSKRISGPSQGEKTQVGLGGNSAEARTLEGAGREKKGEGGEQR